MTIEETNKIFNTITSNGCREMNEVRFHQAVNEAIIACETLQKRFDIYARAINQIDDFFEYRYRKYSGEQTKEFIMDILDNITKQLMRNIVINFGADYNGDLLKAGDRVRSIYARCEPDNIGTITAEGFIIYDDEPETEYQILNSKYLVKI